MTVRSIVRTTTAPAAAPGFIGEGYLAVEVLATEALEGVDPFVLLMDDRLELPQRRRIGGAHPHAGLETVTLVLEGTLWDRDEGELSAGDALWMTAGRGIIHNEHVEVAGRARVLQLWIRLPARDREQAPGFEVISRKTVPVRREPGAVARLYSGATGDLTSPTTNRVPITLVDLELEAQASLTQQLPASFNGFLYVLDGEVAVGATRVRAGQVGWLDRPAAPGTSTVTFTGGDRGARLVLYTGEPQREPLIHHGPFVAGSEREIAQLFRRFRAGEFESMSAIARGSREVANLHEGSRP